MNNYLNGLSGNGFLKDFNMKKTIIAWLFIASLKIQSLEVSDLPKLYKQLKETDAQFEPRVRGACGYSELKEEVSTLAAFAMGGLVAGFVTKAVKNSSANHPGRKPGIFITAVFPGITTAIFCKLIVVEFKPLCWYQHIAYSNAMGAIQRKIEILERFK